eukprot:5032994-Heterocapsa_arctica.AAC.1
MFQRDLVALEDDILEVAVGNCVSLVAVLLELQLEEQEILTPGQELAVLGSLIHHDRELTCRLALRDLVQRSLQLSIETTERVFDVALHVVVSDVDMLHDEDPLDAFRRVVARRHNLA